MEQGYYQEYITDEYEILTERGFKSFGGFVERISSTNQLIINGSSLRATANHEFMLANGAWVRCSNIEPGEELFGGVVESIIDGDIEFVYDALEVEDTHSYITNGVVSHNCNMVYLDEFAHITLNLQEAFFSSTYPTITSGKNTKVIITSTPKGFEMFHKFWKEATVDKDDNPIDTTLETPIPGKNGYVAIETRWNDIPGRDEEWKNLILGTISQEQFDQEYNCAFLGSSGTLISGVHLSRMVYRKPILTRQYTNVYYKPEKDRQYVAVVDTSRGVGADHNVCSVFDVTETPFKQALIIRSNQIAPQHFPEYIASACKAYNDAPVLVETNDNGQQIADALHFDLDVDSVLMTSSNAKKGQTISGGYGANARRGVKTSTAVKRIGCSTLKALIENNVLLIEDFETIQELSSFVSKGNSYEAEAGKHDDIVATLFLFAWLTTQRYFKELTNKDARGQMASDHASAMEEELAPFGFFGFEMDDADFES